MKFVDYKCPNCGDSLRFEKGDSIVTCKSCRSTLHIEPDTTDKLFRAFDLIEVHRFIAATNLLNEILNVDSKNGQVYLGLLLCDTECTSIEGLASTKYSFFNNHNYKNALEFLPINQRDEIISLCYQNQAKKGDKKIQPTENMIALSRLSNIEFVDGYTVVQIYHTLDFSNIDEDTVIDFYRETADDMEKMIYLYNMLSIQEKQGIDNFNIDEFELAVDVYLQIKNIIKSIS